MFKEIIEKYNSQTYRIQQANQKYYKEFIISWEELNNWPKELHKKLVEEIPFSRLELLKTEVSNDKKTEKALFRTTKGNYVESVLIRSKDRNTVCISCMSGCPVGCIFCATGQMGLNELLDENQIIDQVLYFGRKLKSKGDKITNIVYMGMGEPMLNLEHVTRSIEILTDSNKMGFSKRRITVSTSGHIPNLKKFLNMKSNVILAISLHAPNQELRDKLMPSISTKNSLIDLFELLDSYTLETNKRITYEYVLLKGINDSDDNAYELSELLRDRLALVNLINYNENECFDLKKSNNTEEFQRILLSNGINCTIRKSYGDDIKGACGQLAT
jgi:23S rRNA (adenine2503-C2)-methyltransferase